MARKQIDDTPRDNVSKLIDDLSPLLRIDKHKLDDALEERADSFHRVADALALAISHQDAGKSALDEIEANVDAELRRDAERSDQKITEKYIEAQKHLDRRVSQAKQHLNDCKLRVARLTALKEAFQQRGYAIGNLCELFQAGYYSDATNNKLERNHRDLKADRVHRLRNERL